MKQFHRDKLNKIFSPSVIRGLAIALIRQVGPSLKQSSQFLKKRSQSRPKKPTRPELTGDGMYVEAFVSDTLPALIGKIRKVESLEIVLKIPENVPIFHELTTWLKLSSYTHQSGQIIAIASTDQLVQQLAKLVGIPIASSEWYFGPSIRIRRISRIYSRNLLKIGSFLLILVGVWVGATTVFDQISHVEIQLSPAGHERSVDVIFSVSDLIQDSDLLKRVIKGRSVRQETEATVIVATTGIDSLGSEKAIVNLEFTNSSSKNYSVASGFLVGTKEGINFRTTVSITLEPDEVKQVAAICDLPGTLGNVQAGTITESTLPIEITAINPNPASGGADTIWAIVDAADILTAHKYSRDVLATRGVKALRSVETGGELVTATVSTPILSQEARQGIGDKSEVFVIDYIIVASGLVVDLSEAERLMGMILSSTLESHEELIGLTKLDIVDAPELGNDKVRIRGTGRVINVEGWARDLSDSLKSASLEDADIILKQYLSLDESPIIIFRPSFFPARSLPRLARNIQIHLLIPEQKNARYARDGKNNE